MSDDDRRILAVIVTDILNAHAPQCQKVNAILKIIAAYERAVVDSLPGIKVLDGRSY